MKLKYIPFNSEIPEECEQYIFKYSKKYQKLKASGH